MTFRIAATRLGAAAQLEGRVLELTAAISRMLWNGTVKGWNNGDHLARAENEPFFGHDRIGLLIWRMKSKGLTRRSAG